MLYLEQSKTAQVEGDAEGAEERRAEVRFGRVSGLRLSFRSLVHVDSLQDLTSLRTLQLDNNALTRLENLDHLVRRACGKPGCLATSECWAAPAACSGLLCSVCPCANEAKAWSGQAVVWLKKLGLVVE